jgi:hypothetical protein
MKKKLAKIAVLLIVIFSLNILFQSIIAQGEADPQALKAARAGYKAGISRGWNDWRGGTPS